MRIGVLALQGAFIEHQKILAAIGVDSIQVRKREELDQIDGLIIPGGESTTIGKLMNEFNLIDRIKDLGQSGMPIFGTCAGLIMMAKDIYESNQPSLGLMNIVAHRNAFGRQVDSFETDLQVDALGDKPFRAVFIRAPYVKEVKNDVQVLAEVNDKIVLVRENNLLAAAFHPELTDDARIHELFLEQVKNYLDRN